MGDRLEGHGGGRARDPESRAGRGRNPGTDGLWNAATKAPVPVVFGFSGDPVEHKLVESFARPGGAVTGMSYLALDLVGKRIELLKEWLPQTQRLAIIGAAAAPG